MSKERIDVHGHYFPPAYVQFLKRHGMQLLDGVKAPEWSIERQWEYMQALNISFATLSISSPHFHCGDAAEAAEVARGSNEYGAALTKQYPDKLAALASLPLPEIGPSVQEIRYCREVLGLRGFALLTNYRGVYLGSRLFDPVMEELNKQPTLITIHPTTPFRRVTDEEEILPAPVMEYFFETTRAVVNLIINGTLAKYPNLHFIVPHGGAFLTILSDRLIPLAGVLLKDKGLDIAGDLSRLYYDLAGFSMSKQFDLLRTMTSESHLLYGSDSPFTFLPLCLKQAEAMDEKTGELSDKIYKLNALELFKKTSIL